MKYAVIIPDGAADVPLEELEGRTPLEAAEIPNIAWIAENGRVGTVRNVPEGMPPGSDVATMSLLGYDPTEFYTGRAPIEAAAQRIEVAPDEWIFRCNFVTLVDGQMEDYSAGHISTEEARELIALLNDDVAGEGLRFHSGVSYRHLMVARGDFAVETTPPHDLLSKPVGDALPRGRGSDLLKQVMAAARKALDTSEINATRRDLGDNPATDVWLWGEGKMPKLPAFESRYGKVGRMITAVDLLRGLAALIGWDRIEVPGATGYIDTNYAGKGEAAVAALDECDLVCVHVEAPDEAGHNADVQGKVHSIEQIDRHIVGPLLERLRAEGDAWRVLVLPDHPTPCTIRTHTSVPVPFVIAGKRIESVRHGRFTEADADAGDLHIARGCDLMEYFLTVR